MTTDEKLNYVKQTLGYSLYEAQISLCELLATTTKPIRLLNDHYIAKLYDTERRFAEYINDFM